MRHTGTGFRSVMVALGAWLALFVSAPLATAQVSDISLSDLTRLRGLGSDEIWGLGLVVGLSNSGDSPDLLPKARQIAQLLEHGGLPVGELGELMAGKSVAVVMVTARLPEGSVVSGDRFDLHVQTMFDAKDLSGGRLISAPMRSVIPGNPYVYAFGSGLLSSDGSESTTVARVAKGCRLIRDINKPVVDEYGTLTFEVRENYTGFKTTTLIADLINQDRQGLRADGAPPIAYAINDRSVRVQIPDEEMVNPTRFIASLQKIRFDQSLMGVDPSIMIDERAGVITITGNVLITPSVISSGRLIVTVLDPPIPATPQNPEITQSSSTLIGTSTNPKDNAQAQALLEAMRRLEVPVEDQISIFRTLEGNSALSVRIKWVAS